MSDDADTPTGKSLGFAWPIVVVVAVAGVLLIGWFGLPSWLRVGSPFGGGHYKYHLGSVVVGDCMDAIDKKGSFGGTPPQYIWQYATGWEERDSSGVGVATATNDHPRVICHMQLAPAPVDGP